MSHFNRRQSVSGTPRGSFRRNYIIPHLLTPRSLQQIFFLKAELKDRDDEIGLECPESVPGCFTLGPCGHFSGAQTNQLSGELNLGHL